MRKMKDSGITWIKEIPETWNVQRGKNILTLMKRSPEGYDEVITCFRDGEVTLRSNRREDGFTFSDKEIGYQGIEKGDLVIHGMDGFAGAIGISDSCGKGSPVLVVCTTKNNSKFLMYYLRMLATQNVFVAMATGIRERSCDLRWNKIADLLFPIPTINEQKQIADYLDEKCSKIDDIIARQEEIIEKLKEYKLSIITEAVTKGLNSKAEMRNSGICEIGDVPKTCKITKLKYICNTQGRIGFKGYTTADLVDEGEGAYTLGASHMNNGKVDLSSPVYISWEKYYESPEIMVKKNDLLIVQRGSTIGKVAIVDKDYGELTINPSLVLINKITINSKYLLYALSARYIVNYIALIGTTTAIPMISQKQINELQVVLPSSDQQRMIVEYLDEKCSRLDKTINDRQRVIEKWSEYKKSLIYEVVTGKKEV